MNENKRNIRRIEKIFFIGIGGVGMSAIAEVMLDLGYKISGSDLKQSAISQRLEEKGVKVFYGHKADNLAEDVDVVVVSSAINLENPEIVKAHNLGIPVIRRAEMLAEIMRFRQGIAIAGTHGKTTTTSLTASILSDAGLDPTFIIGGVLNSAGSNARLGKGDYLVAEADESDTSFWLLQPIISVVTNIDADHLENYQGSYEVLKEGFLRFLRNLPFYGLAVLCIDDKGIREILPRIPRKFRTYGFSEDADIRAFNIKKNGLTTCFEVNDGEKIFPVKLNMAGKHNVLNALAAITVARELDISRDVIIDSLAKFGGVGRRFTYHGKINHAWGTADIFEDYGHHPSEIKAVLDSAKESFPNRRILPVFQPHRYTRTRDLLDDFAAVLSDSEALVLTEVYSAGEQPIAGADSKALSRAIRAFGQVEPVLISDKKEIIENLKSHILKDNDVVIFLGAGDIGRLAKEIVAENK